MIIVKMNETGTLTIMGSNVKLLRAGVDHTVISNSKFHGKFKNEIINLINDGCVHNDNINDVPQEMIKTAIEFISTLPKKPTDIHTVVKCRFVQHDVYGVIFKACDLPEILKGITEPSVNLDYKVVRGMIDGLTEDNIKMLNKSLVELSVYDSKYIKTLSTGDFRLYRKVRIVELYQNILNKLGLDFDDARTKYINMLPDLFADL